MAVEKGSEGSKTSSGEGSGTGRSPVADLVLHIVLYALVRLALVAIIVAVVLGVGRLAGLTVPLVVALLFGFVIAMPLAILLFRGRRERLQQAIAVVDAQRSQDRADLRARMRGGASPKQDASRRPKARRGKGGA